MFEELWVRVSFQGGETPTSPLLKFEQQWLAIWISIWVAKMAKMHFIQRWLARFRVARGFPPSERGGRGGVNTTTLPFAINTAGKRSPPYPPFSRLSLTHKSLIGRGWGRANVKKLDGVCGISNVQQGISNEQGKNHTIAGGVLNTKCSDELSDRKAVNAFFHG